MYRLCGCDPSTDGFYLVTLQSNTEGGWRYAAVSGSLKHGKCSFEEALQVMLSCSACGMEKPFKHRVHPAAVREVMETFENTIRLDERLRAGNALVLLEEVTEINLQLMGGAPSKDADPIVTEWLLSIGLRKLGYSRDDAQQTVSTKGALSNPDRRAAAMAAEAARRKFVSGEWKDAE